MDQTVPMSARRLTWLGVIGPLGYLALFGLGWLVLNHFFPPFSPDETAQQMADRFLSRRTTIMLGSVCMMVATMVLMVYAALMVIVVWRAEGGIGLYTLLMLFTQGTYLVMNFFVSFFFAMAVFRTERSPELIQFAGDLSFMQFMGGIPMFFMIWVVAAIVSLKAPREDAVIPRWYGYLNLWSALLYVPELLIFFFRTGPFAWDGIVGFYIPAIVFIVYFLATPVAVRQVARSHFPEAP